ncbi:terpenoid synthase [Trametes punicea]|nr:terpenoid synthase [Trametes punicea]
MLGVASQPSVPLHAVDAQYILPVHGQQLRALGHSKFNNSSNDKFGAQDQLPHDIRQEIRSIMRTFLQGCRFEDAQSPRDVDLRHDIASEVASWDSGLSPARAAKLVDTSCYFTETAYAHTSPAHRRFITRYTAYFLFADDLGGQHLEALRQFPRRFANGERQLNPVLDRLAEMVKGAHELWTDIGTNSIITGTLEAITANYIEFSLRDMVMKPGALRYADHLRLRSGIDPPFIAFIFMRSWRETAESYVQLLPDMEYWIGAVNDILSFYKEELAHETNNYIHLRAAAEQRSCLTVLRTLVDEVLETTHRLDQLVDDDPELAVLWRGYVQRFLEFSVKASRYRLKDLELTARANEC